MKLFSNNTELEYVLSKFGVVSTVDLNFDPQEDDVLCFYFDTINREKVKHYEEKYANCKKIYIFRREIAFYFFNYISPSTASFILESEIIDQFSVCYQSTVSNGMYISMFFKGIIKIRQKFDGLTNRDLDMIDLLKDGYSYQDIADVTHLQYGTVRNYVSRILDITNTANKTELALNFQRILNEPDDY